MAAAKLSPAKLNRPRESAAFAEHQAWLGETRRKAALAMGEWLIQTAKLSKPVKELTLPELEAMADNAISIYLAEREVRRKALEVRFSVGLEPDPMDALGA